MTPAEQIHAAQVVGCKALLIECTLVNYKCSTAASRCATHLQQLLGETGGDDAQKTPKLPRELELEPKHDFDTSNTSGQ